METGLGIKGNTVSKGATRIDQDVPWVLHPTKNRGYPLPFDYPAGDRLIVKVYIDQINSRRVCRKVKSLTDVAAGRLNLLPDNGFAQHIVNGDRTLLNRFVQLQVNIENIIRWIGVDLETFLRKVIFNTRDS